MALPFLLLMTSGSPSTQTRVCFWYHTNEIKNHSTLKQDCKLNTSHSMASIDLKKPISQYNRDLSPNELEILRLPSKYNLQIQNIPKKLKKLICSKNYPFINDFVGIEVETY